MRINGFEQIKAFYSWVFNNSEKATSQHISLYLFLLNQNNRCNWVEWFKCPIDLGLHGSCLSKKTYYKCLSELSEWGLIGYKKGINDYKAPLIKLIVLHDEFESNIPISEVEICTATDTATAPQPIPLPTPQVVTLPTPLLPPIYKQVTDNIQRITKNIDAVLNFLDDLETTPEIQIEYLAIFKKITGKKIMKLSDKVKGQISARITEGYTLDELEKVILNIKADKFHIESGFKYLTPEFATRNDKVIQYLNVVEKTNSIPNTR